MTKHTFLQKLEKNIKHFPKEDQKEILSFYEECISDAEDTGETETSFIYKIGSIDELVTKLEKDYTLEPVTIAHNWTLIKEGFKGHSNFSGTAKLLFLLSTLGSIIVALVIDFFIIKKVFLLGRDIYYYPELGLHSIVPKIAFMLLGVGLILLSVYLLIKLIAFLIMYFGNNIRKEQ